MIEVVTFRVLVKPDDILEKDERYQAAKRIGLEIIGSQKDREQAAVDKGTVVSFGPTAFKDFGVENAVAPGDKIVYAKHAGKEVVDTDGTKYVVINDEDVVAIIKD